MIPNKFSTVDLEGIDIVESQGIEIPGLYQKLTNAIMQCRYQVIYNWKFDGIVIPPSYVEMIVVNNEVKINSRISVTEDDILHVYSLEIPAILEELNVTSNGTYTPPEGVDGFSKVTVDVPDIPPVLSELSVAQNGIYLPDQGVDGFYRVNVDVPIPASPIIQPSFFNLSYAYLANSGSFFTYESRTNALGIFEVTPGTFEIFLTGTTSNRFRVHFYADKYYSDFAEYIDNPYPNAEVYVSTANISGSPDVPRYDLRFLYTAQQSGSILVMTSATSSLTSIPNVIKLS